VQHADEQQYITFWEAAKPRTPSLSHRERTQATDRLVNGNIIRVHVSFCRFRLALWMI
jgi:hypothetical protein